MEAWGEIRAVDFTEWIIERGYSYEEDDHYWYETIMTGDVIEYPRICKTTAELYAIYKNNKP